MKLTKTIFTGFAPNLTKKDVLNALGFIFLPWRWPKLKNGNSGEEVKSWLQEYLPIKKVFLIDSGRSALYFSLKALGIGYGDEILLQAYTCVVVVNAIKFTGAKPVYVDIDENFNLDPADLTKKINSKTKAVIIQHTFGVAANMNEIINITKKYNLKTIEDCAHSLGASYGDKKLGTLSDITILSFGSDKVVSCNRGGAMITNNDDSAKKIEEFYNRLPNHSLIKIFQYLAHFPLFFIGKMLYSFQIGKVILYLAKKLHLVNRVIYNPEKKGKQLLIYPAKLPNCLAYILLEQLKNLESNNTHRFGIAKFYVENIKQPQIIMPRLNKEAIYLRFNVLTDKPNILSAIGLKNNVIFGDWYNTVIAPKDIDMEMTGYIKGSCVKAEKFSSQSINLPTNINLKSAQKIVAIVNSL